MDTLTHKLPGHDRDAYPDNRMVLEKPDEARPTYKSWKKKYKKMKIVFDDKMRQSNSFFIEEQAALKTARRLAQENDRLLDLLTDINNSAQIPVDRRIDLDVDIPSLSAVPSLISVEELSQAAEVDSPDGQAIYNEVCSMIAEKAASKSASKPTKSLATLLTNTPHLTLQSPILSTDLLASLEAPEGLPAPISYLTPDQVDDYLYDTDANLGLVPPAPLPAPSAPPEASLHEDLQLKNPNSVYNWLRRNEPKIFLQDGEGSEKSQGKPGALRGAGKRASIPAPVKHEALEFVEEDGLAYEGVISVTGPSAKGKRKREEDDTGYHPKKGNLEKKTKVKRKKVDGEMTAGSGKKGKAKARPTSPAMGDPLASAS